jgi:hypothetical protein
MMKINITDSITTSHIDDMEDDVDDNVDMFDVVADDKTADMVMMWMEIMMCTLTWPMTCLLTWK